MHLWSKKNSNLNVPLSFKDMSNWGGMLDILRNNLFGHPNHTCILKKEQYCCNPTLKECEDDTHILEMGTWESSGTSENPEFNCRGQNTSPWGVLYTVGKVLKCKCRKWHCMNHSDIFSTSCGRKKGWESNCQFDSRPLKVGNRPDPGVCKCNATHCWKASRRATSLLQTSSQSEVWARSYELPKSWESKPRKVPFECRCHGVMQRILYWGRWWPPLSPGRGESCESRVAYGLS
jgi:hypothetical protein